MEMYHIEKLLTETDVTRTSRPNKLCKAKSVGILMITCQENDLTLNVEASKVIWRVWVTGHQFDYHLNS